VRVHGRWLRAQPESVRSERHVHEEHSEEHSRAAPVGVHLRMRRGLRGRKMQQVRPRLHVAQRMQRCVRAQSLPIRGCCAAPSSCRCSTIGAVCPLGTEMRRHSEGTGYLKVFAGSGMAMMTTSIIAMVFIFLKVLTSDPGMPMDHAEALVAMGMKHAKQTGDSHNFTDNQDRRRGRRTGVRNQTAQSSSVLSARSTRRNSVAMLCVTRTLPRSLPRSLAPSLARSLRPVSHPSVTRWPSGGGGNDQPSTSWQRPQRTSRSHVRSGSRGEATEPTGLDCVTRYLRDGRKACCGALTD
jgi:hypothetical protein